MDGRASQPLLNWAAQGTEPFAQAPAGGVFQARAVNNNYSLGPHAALQLERHLGNSGWSLSTRVDAAGLFDFLDEGWLTKSGAPRRRRPATGRRVIRLPPPSLADVHRPNRTQLATLA